MTLTPQIFSIVLTAFLAYSGFLVGIIRWFQSKNEALLNARLEIIEKSITELKLDIKGVSSTMPKEYVMKNDCLRQQEAILSRLVLIDRKIDELTKGVYQNAKE